MARAAGEKSGSRHAPFIRRGGATQCFLVRWHGVRGEETGIKVKVSVLASAKMLFLWVKFWNLFFQFRFTGVVFNQVLQRKQR